MKRIIIAGGGTGGHFYPGFSLAKKLIKENYQILFIIKKNDISKKILEENEIPFVEIDMISMPRTLNPFPYIKFLIKLFYSLIFSLKIISDFEPEIILGTGSYIAFPVILAGKIKKKKTFIHESNAVLGLSNYLSAFFVDKVLLGLPLRENPFKNKSILIGTFLREEFENNLDKKEIRKELNIKENDFVLLVFGGSQGSKNINYAIYRILLDSLNENKKINLIQITGEKNFNEIKEKYEKASLLTENIKLFNYYNDMVKLYNASDLIISRSGSGTITEILKTKIPSILIPLKTSAKNHQEENAQILFKAGTSIILKDDENLYTNLKNTLNNLINEKNIKVMQKAYERISIPYGEEAYKNFLNLIKKD